MNINLSPPLAEAVEAYRRRWADRVAGDPDRTKPPSTGDVLRRGLRMLLAAEDGQDPDRAGANTGASR